MVHGSTAHEVLCVVFHYVEPDLRVLLWRRALEPQAGRWALPGGVVRVDENALTSARRQLAEKVDLVDVAHLEQLSLYSDPHRMPPTPGADRTIASTFLGLVRSDTALSPPEDTAWHPISALPEIAFDHAIMVHNARTRLAAKLSYTNIGFALAPKEFPVSEVRDIYAAALGHPVDATNLLRILSRRGVISATGATAPSGKTGGRPPALYRFTESRLRITDEFATLRPPGAPT